MGTALRTLACFGCLCLAGCAGMHLARTAKPAAQTPAASVPVQRQPGDSAAAAPAVAAPGATAPGAEASTAGLSPAALLMVNACDNYMAINPSSPKAPEVLSIKAATYYNSRVFEKSREVYQDIVSRFPSTAFGVEAVRMIAQAFYEEKRFDEAQVWYRKLKETAPEGNERQEAVLRIAELIFRLAGSLEEQQKYKDAAEQYERVALEFPESKIADVALFNAGSSYERLAEWSLSILMYQRLVQRYLSSALVPKAIFRTAKSYEKLFQWEQAAESYLRVTASYPKSETAAASLYNAGICFENANKLPEAAATFEKFAQLFPGAEDVADVLFKSGELYGKIKDWEGVTRVNKEFSRRFGGDPDRAVQAQCMIGVALYMQEREAEAITQLQEAINTYSRLSNPSPINKFYAAKAKFTVAEINHNAMNKIRLVQPESAYRKALKDKSDLLEQAVKNYSAVVSYGISEWTPRSIFQVGQAYEDFAMGLLRQERPRDLSLDRQLALELGIAKAVEDYFIAKAMHYHEQNVKLGIKEKIEDKFVLQSRVKLIFLPFTAGKNYLMLVDIAKSSEDDGKQAGFALIARKLETLQKIAPFQERAIDLFYTCLEKGALYAEINDFYTQASSLVTGISFGVGETYAEVATIAREAPIPETFDPYDAYVYKTKLLQQIQGYEDQAMRNFLRTVKIGEAYKLTDEYVTRSRGKMAEVLFVKGRCLDLLGTSAMTDPPYPADINAAEREEFKARFEEVGMKLQEQAFDIYRTILENAEQNYAAGPYVTHAYVRLFQFYPNEFGLKQESIKPRSFGSDPEWKASADSAAGWETLDFADGGWAKAQKGRVDRGVVISGFPADVPAPLWFSNNPDSGSAVAPGTVFFRRTFYNKEIPHKAELSVASTGPAAVYLNGTAVEGDSTVSGPWTRTRTWNVMGRLREGKNVIAVRAEGGAAGGDGVFPYLTVMVPQADYVPKPPGFDVPLAAEDVAVDVYKFPFVKNFSPENGNDQGKTVAQ